MVIIPGSGETAERAVQQIELPTLITEIGFLTNIPILEERRLSFGIDSLSQNSLTAIYQTLKNEQT